MCIASVARRRAGASPATPSASVARSYAMGLPDIEEYIGHKIPVAKYDHSTYSPNS